ncbi:MAG: hypothetical protein HYU98_05105 [Deltaproteobacteria bacterium]|nr:hypothetical protein [Deltaproteobacteria bacterium]
MGEEIGAGAHVTELRRLKCGQYGISEAFKLEEVSTLQDVMRMLETQPELNYGTTNRKEERSDDKVQIA